MILLTNQRDITEYAMMADALPFVEMLRFPVRGGRGFGGRMRGLGTLISLGPSPSSESLLKSDE